MGGAVRAANLRRRLSFPTVCAPHALVRASYTTVEAPCQTVIVPMLRILSRRWKRVGKNLILFRCQLYWKSERCLHCMCQQQVLGRGEIG